MADTNLYGLTGAGYTADSGGQRIDGRRVLETLSPVQAAIAAYTTGSGEGAMDYAAQPAQFLANGLIDEAFANANGFGDLWRSGYSEKMLGSGEWDNDDISYNLSDELAAKLQQDEIAKLGFGDDLRQTAIIDKSTGKVVKATEPKAYSGFKDWAKTALPMVLSIAVPGLGTALGSALGATGQAATALGNSLVQGSLSALNGGDFVKGALAGGLGGFAGGAASAAAGGGAWGQLAGQLARNTVSGAIRGGSLTDALKGSIGGMLSPGNLLSMGGSALGLGSGYGPDAQGMRSLVPGFFDDGGEGYAAPDAGGGAMFDWMDDPGVTWDTSGPIEDFTDTSDYGSWLPGANWGGGGLPEADYSNEGRNHPGVDRDGDGNTDVLAPGDPGLGGWGGGSGGSPFGTLAGVLRGLLGTSAGSGGAQGGSLAAVIASLIGQQAASGQSRDALALQRDALNAQKGIADRQLKLAEDQWNRYLNTYGPLENEFVQEARDYGSQANRERAATGAGATVASNYANLRERLSEAPGLDPSSQTYLSTMRKLGVEEAAQKSAAETGARDKVDAQGFARLGDAVSLGKGLPANASTALRGAGAAYAGLNDAGVAAGQQAANRARSVGGMWGDVLTNPTVQSGIDKAIDWAGGLFGDDK
jgi:hypothetical protein